MLPLILSLAGLILSVGVPAGYFLLLRVPSVRNATAGPLLLALVPLLLVGAALALGRSLAAITVSSAASFLSLGFIYYLVRYSRLPAAGVRLGPGDRAPGFTLPDAAGRPVALSEVVDRGPVALVFFRGGW